MPNSEAPRGDMPGGGPADRSRPQARSTPSPREDGQSEDALRRSRHTLSTILKNLPGMAYRCRNDREWTMEFVSGGCLALTGYRAEDLTENRAVSYGSLIHPEDKEKVWTSVQEALEQKAPFRVIYRLTASSGEEKWVWEQGSGVYSAEGRLIAIEGFITDITQRKQVEEEVLRHRDHLEEMVAERTSQLKEANDQLRREIEERKQAEKGLRESQQRLGAIFDHTLQFIGLLTPEGDLIEVNRTALDFCGREKAEVLGKPFWETPWWTHSEELQERLRRGVKQAAQGEVVRFEATHRTPDGGLACIDFSLKPVTDEEGNVVLLIPEGRDITDRKRAEVALRESEDTARALLNAPTDSAILLDTAGRVRAINERAARRLGKRPEKIVGALVFDFLPPEVAGRGRQIHNQAIQSGLPVHYEEERKGRYYDTSIIPVFNSEGRVGQVAVYARDVTKYKRAVARIKERTAALVESEEKYRTLVENVPLVVYRMDWKGEILFINQFVEETFGYSPEEILRDPEIWNQKVYREDQAKVAGLRNKNLMDGDEFVADYRVVHKEGRIVYVVDRAIPIRGEGGRISRVDGIIMDVTESVKLREKLVRSEGLKTISQVSARLAHEIRNPLVSAGGFARRLLASMGPDDPKRAKVEIIVKEVGRLETILRMMLNYIQPLDLDLSQTDPNEMVTRALAALDLEVGAKGVQVDMRLTEGLQKVSVDEPRMELAIETLVRQALNQMPDGAVLSFRTFQENDMFNLIIRYPVRHVSADDVEHFFYPFTASGATGGEIDLPMSKILVDKHGGVVDVRLLKNGDLAIHLALPC